jgi:O-antigen ligase
VAVRGVSWAVLVAGALLGARPALHGARPVVWLLGAAAALAVLQLVPLPPALWQALPGRGVFADAAALSGQPQPWRPWSIVPGATYNALFSLVVPLAVLLLATGARPAERAILPGAMLALVTVSTLVGLLQFSGGGFTNPLVNDTLGQVSGTFANRNHFALFVAFGCVLAPVWAFLEGRRPHWRGPVALGLLPLFALTILASGSRAGIAVGMLGLAAGLVIVWRPLRRELGRYPPWVLPALIGGFAVTLALLVAISFAADRAVSISRALNLSSGQDMRQRGLPTLIDMVRTYFPAGTGLGSFDPMFRMHEPFKLLKLTYFNHAHNDFLEIVLDAGLPGLLLLLAAVGWWLWASARAWRNKQAVAQLGSVLLLQVLMASIVDYPARTPLIMALMVVAALWLGTTASPARPALPLERQDL